MARPVINQVSPGLNTNKSGQCHLLIKATNLTNTSTATITGGKHEWQLRYPRNRLIDGQWLVVIVKCLRDTRDTDNVTMTVTDTPGGISSLPMNVSMVLYDDT